MTVYNPISNSGGGGTTVQSLFVDGVAKEQISSDGTINWTGSDPITLAIAPTFDIFGSTNGLTKVSATGTVNGTNTSFTFTIAPQAIFVDGKVLQQVSSDGTINWTGTTSVTLSIAPTSDIFGATFTKIYTVSKVNGLNTVFSFNTDLLPLTGVVNGINRVFVFQLAPSIVFVDGVPKEATSSDGTVNWTGTTTITLVIAPTFDIYAYG